MFYKVTLGFTTGATYNMTNVHVFKAAQARRAYFSKVKSAVQNFQLQIFLKTRRHGKYQMNMIQTHSSNYIDTSVV